MTISLRKSVTPTRHDDDWFLMHAVERFLKNVAKYFEQMK